MPEARLIKEFVYYFFANSWGISEWGFRISVEFYFQNLSQT
jgi:hypothetical protein